MTILDMINDSFVKYPNNKALSVLDNRTYTYRDVENNVTEYAKLLIKLGIKSGDKVAIFAPSSPEWGMAYLAIVSLGAVAIPILPDFSKEEVSNVLEHSEAKLVFAAKNKKNLVDEKLVNNVLTLDENLLNNRKDKPQKVNYEFLNKEVKEEDLASIIYTSGTTGKSKGVELTHKNITFMVKQCENIIKITPEDRALSILPMAHIYEFTIGFMIPVASGSNITYLEKPASPSVLVDALKKVKPTFMLSVPMVIEKVYNKKIAPLYNEGGPLEKIKDKPAIRKPVNKLVGLSLKKAFGGKLRFFGIGGAKLNPEVESFLKEANFPYAIGYGLTETSPLVAGCNPSKTKVGSTGPKLTNTDIKLTNVNEEGIGEILTKGYHVMRGYHKDPELTKSVMTDDNYFKTGDLGSIDDDGYLYIKGRLKNMILGPNGENIYPENISFIINQHLLVEESLVIEDKNSGLIALVKLNYENVNKYIEEHKVSLNEVYSIIKEYVNSKVNKGSKIKEVEEVKEFEKTPTQKIKTFKHQRKNN